MKTKTARQIANQAQCLSEAICRIINDPNTNRNECRKLYNRLDAIFLLRMHYLQNIDRYLCKQTGRNVGKSEFYGTPIPRKVYADY